MVHFASLWCIAVSLWSDSVSLWCDSVILWCNSLSLWCIAASFGCILSVHGAFVPVYGAFCQSMVHFCQSMVLYFPGLTIILTAVSRIRLLRIRSSPLERKANFPKKRRNFEDYSRGRFFGSSFVVPPLLASLGMLVVLEKTFPPIINVKYLIS